MSQKWWLSIYHKSKNTRQMELKFGVATILYKYSDLTKFDKNLKGSRFIFRWFEMEWPRSMPLVDICWSLSSHCSKDSAALLSCSWCLLCTSWCCLLSALRASWLVLSRYLRIFKSAALWWVVSAACWALSQSLLLAVIANFLDFNFNISAGYS